MTNAGTKVGVAVLRPLGGAATPPSPWPSRSTRLVLGVVRMMTGKKILLLTQGLLSSDDRILATGLPQS